MELAKDEFLCISIQFIKEEGENIKLSYRQFSDIDNLFDEELSQQYCQKIISNLTQLLEIYVYNDIAQNPPNVPNLPNYQ